MGVAEIEQFCGLARKKNGSILFKKTYSAVFLTPLGCKRPIAGSQGFWDRF